MSEANLLELRKGLASASEERFERLIRERLLPGADKAKIDEKIWDLYGEQWCIMFTDLSGFSRNVAEFGIIHFLQTIYESHRLFLPIIDEHSGILLKVEGDSYLVIFRDPLKALQSACNMQSACKIYNDGRLPEEHVLLCVGLGYGKVLKIGNADVYGAEVNAASKLGEDVAKSWEILSTQAVKDALDHVKEYSFTGIDVVPPGAKKAYRVGYYL